MNQIQEKDSLQKILQYCHEISFSEAAILEARRHWQNGQHVMQKITIITQTSPLKKYILSVLS